MRKRKQVPKWFEGNFTIEMSIILPLILLIICSMLYLLFFLYDESCVQQIGYLAALRGTKQIGDEEEKIKTTDSYCTKMQEEYLWAVKNNEVTIECQGSNISVLLTGQVFTPLGNKFFQNTWTYQIKESAENYKPVHLVRQYKKLQKVLEE